MTYIKNLLLTEGAIFIGCLLMSIIIGASAGFILNDPNAAFDMGLKIGTFFGYAMRVLMILAVPVVIVKTAKNN